MLHAGHDPKSERVHEAAPTGTTVTARRERRIRAWVAVFASYLTLFTVVFGGLAPVSAAMRTADPASAICTHEVPGQPLDPAPAHRHDDNCCLAGCCVAAAADLPGSVAMPVPAGHDVTVSAPFPIGTGLDRRPPASPRLTRGPPPLL